MQRLTASYRPDTSTSPTDSLTTSEDTDMAHLTHMALLMHVAHLTLTPLLGYMAPLTHPHSSGLALLTQTPKSAG